MNDRVECCNTCEMFLDFDQKFRKYGEETSQLNVTFAGFAQA